MKSAHLRITLPVVALTAVAVLMAGCQRSYAYRGMTDDTALRDSLTPEVIAAKTEPQANTLATEEELQGTISSIDTTANSFVVTDATGDSHTVSVKNDTALQLDGEVATFADLQVEHEVAVTAEREGESVIAHWIDAESQ